MLTTAPVQATAELLTDLVSLAKSQHLFLSLYIPTPRSDVASQNIRLRLAPMLERLAEDLAGTPRETAFREERNAVDTYLRSLRPGGEGLALLSSREADVWHALWLPEPVPEHVRFGRGAYVLPLMDALDEWEPVGLAEVAKDKARLMVFVAGRIEEIRYRESEVPGKHKASGGYATRYMRLSATHAAGGGASARFQRHILTHVEDHLKHVVQDLASLHERYGFRRLFLAGPPETLAIFRPLLSRELRSTVSGEISIDRHSTKGKIRAQITQAAQEVERLNEEALVQEIITLGSKGQGAVLGLDSTLWALNRRQLHMLIMAGEMSQPGCMCVWCDLLWPPESVACPQCNQKTVKVDLWEELPGFAMGRNVALEVVHGTAASELWHHDGLAGLLEPPPPH